MKLNVGQTLFSVRDETSVVVVRAPQADVVVECGGVEMVEDKAQAEPSGLSSTTDSGSDAATLLGKRYVGLDGELELLCTKAGAFPLSVDGAQLEMKQARPLPSSD